MKIIELDWIMKNRSELDSEDYLSLEKHDLFNQYDNGELSQNARVMMDVIKLVMDLYNKYVEEE